MKENKLILIWKEISLSIILIFTYIILKLAFYRELINLLTVNQMNKSYNPDIITIVKSIWFVVSVIFVIVILSCMYNIYKKLKGEIYYD